ncbi:MAG: hypothetical protein JJE04_12615 [Acidobacteriia bacterium]|nr:hypothetical protein [Terriglobia bacterium]
MTKLGMFGMLVLPLYGQLFDSSSVQGKYHFVQITVSEERPAEVSNLGGTIIFDGRGGYQFAGQMGVGGEAAQGVGGEGSYSVSSAGRMSMRSPSPPAGRLEIQFGAAGAVLTGASVSSAHGIFAAVRAPEGPASAGVVRGNYAGGYLSFRGGEVGGLTSAFVELTADGRGEIPSAAFLGHAAWIDDVNRAETASRLAYAVRADGTGTIRFASRSDFVTGEREILTSANGDFLLGFGTGAGQRDILLAVRKPPDAGDISLDGLYWMSDLCAANSFTFEPQAARFNSGWGSARMNGSGTALLAQEVRMNGHRVNLTTTNVYRVLPDGSGMFGGQLVPGLKNFALGGSPQVFAGALVGLEGKLTLEHGIFFGVKTPAVSGSGVFLSPFGVVNATSLAPPTASVAPGGIMSLFGSGLAPRTASFQGTPLPDELDGVQVVTNGTAAPILVISDQQINVQMPFDLEAGTASIQVNNNGRTSNTVAVAVAATSPAVFSASQKGFGGALASHADSSLVTRENPARPGETIVLFMSGLGRVEPAVTAGQAGGATPLSRVTGSAPKVLFDGRPGEVLFAGLAPGLVGVYQVNVIVPQETVASDSVTVAVATPDAFTDLVDLPVGR